MNTVANIRRYKQIRLEYRLHPIVNIIGIIPYLVTCIVYEVGHLTEVDPVFGVRGSVISGVALIHSGYRVESLQGDHWEKLPKATDAWRNNSHY